MLRLKGTPNGCFNEMAVLNGMGTLETPEFLKSKIDLFGGPVAFNHYAVGWRTRWTRPISGPAGGVALGRHA